MDALEQSIRLVVKAPNQQIEDQEVECGLNWTVKKLKGHLSEAYPSNPRMEDQKLIYSGQLLHDHLTLKDFLRQYDTEKVHTVHLVCITSKDSSSNKSVSQGANGSSSSQNVLRNPVLQGQQHVEPAPTSVLQPTASVIPSIINHLTPGTSEQMQQITWMHQMYGQYMAYYYQQFQAMQHQTVRRTEMSNEITVPAPPPPPPPTSVVQPPPPPPAEQRAPLANIRMNAQGGPVDDDDEDDVGPGNWDWLDWAHVLSRIIVLFSIVYFYSSFSRFIMVLLVAVLMYLYQMGWLNARRRQRRINPANHDGNARRREAEEVVPAADDNRVEQVAAEDVEAERMRQEIQEIENLMNDGMINDNRERMTSLANVAWTFLSTFFSSLLPETPAPLNLN